MAEGEALAGTGPHEIERLFFGHCRIEPAWPSFDFAVDVTTVYERKLQALAVYESRLQRLAGGPARQVQG